MSDDKMDTKEQDRYLPIANISRIMKKSLPPNAKISKEAKECVQECVSEFIAFVTSEASDKCKQEKRKTINGDDLLWAMGTLGFDRYLEPLKTYLNKYRECAKSDNEASGDEGLDDKKSEDNSLPLNFTQHQPIPSLQMNNNINGSLPGLSDPSQTINNSPYNFSGIPNPLNRQ
ncbi:hypothetical protein WA158_005515 [Blastocystis sp. Blastoise]